MSTVNPGQFVNNLGASYGPDSVFPPVYLTGATLSANAAAFPTLTFPAYASLYIYVNVTGYGGSDVVSLRFNGDTGTNYVDRTITAAAGGVVLTDTPTASTTLIRMGIPTNQGRIVQVQILNALARRKVVMINNQIGSADATAPAAIHLGGLGLWNNTTAQITQLDVPTAGGLNILSGSSIMVFGGY